MPTAGALGLYDRPVLVVELGTHQAFISKLDADRQGQFLVTASYDKTVRVWSAATGELQRTIRLPAGPGHMGKAFTAAISPDGALIAVGGWMRRTEEDPEECVYVFERGTGQLAHRIGGLPGCAFNLAFSPDGMRLAVALGSGCGVRLLNLAKGSEGEVVAADEGYAADSYGLAFDAAGRLAASSLDGLVRLYDPDLHLDCTVKAPDGRQCYEIAFSPDGRQLAVGYANAAVIDVLDGSTLRHLFLAEPRGVGRGALLRVAWSTDGDSLLAAGDWSLGGVGHRLRRWPEGGRGSPSDRPLSQNTITALCPLPGGRLAFAAADPRLGVLDAEGDQVWTIPPATTDFRDHPTVALAVAADGAQVAFRSKRWEDSQCDWDKRLMVFSVPASRLTEDDKPESLVWPRTAAPGLALEGCFGTLVPALNGRPLALFANEHARSVAITSDGTYFALGAEWSLYLFDRAGTELWWRNVPGQTWAVNVSGDGRLVVATHHDGTIRWYRIDDGTELLALLPLADRKRWVAWTPEGYYAASASPGMGDVLGWHVNRGWDKAADFYPVTAYAGFCRPDALPLVLREGETARALGLAKMAYDRRQVQEAVDSPVPAGPQLHVLTVGINEYACHERRRLDFAVNDACDLANTLLAQEAAGLYSKVNLECLVDAQATREGFFAGLLRLLRAMQPDQRDVAVIHFSGHGAQVDGEYYLLPNDVDANDSIALATTSIELRQLTNLLRRFQERGKVLVLLDACHSGGVIEGVRDGLPPDVEAVRAELASAGTGVIVLTSSTGQEVSLERPEWQNGAFTEAVLEALAGQADRDGDRWLSVSELEGYVVRRVRELTGNQQNPRIAVPGGQHYETRLFVTGLL